MHPWHGAKKEAVIEHFAQRSGTPPGDVEVRVTQVGDAFTTMIQEVYFDKDAKISLIDPSLFTFFDTLRSNGVKVALNTGYPPEIQQSLIEHLGFGPHIDGYISAYQVTHGRPYPYMVHQLMERLEIDDVRTVAKAGDSVRDMEEGKNAGCGLVIGVLSGADSSEALHAAGADVVIDCVVNI
uniref:Phosphonoacetaldehyde hydrolase n=1 Tax=Lotharella oceanica TaxID=641309 RepID=A0A7S2X7H2_9EUKA